MKLQSSEVRYRKSRIISKVLGIIFSYVQQNKTYQSLIVGANNPLRDWSLITGRGRYIMGKLRVQNVLPLPSPLKTKTSPHTHTFQGW